MDSKIKIIQTVKNTAIKRLLDLHCKLYEKSLLTRYLAPVCIDLYEASQENIDIMLDLYKAMQSVTPDDLDEIKYDLLKFVIEDKSNAEIQAVINSMMLKAFILHLNDRNNTSLQLLKEYFITLCQTEMVMCNVIKHIKELVEPYKLRKMRDDLLNMLCEKD